MSVYETKENAKLYSNTYCMNRVDGGRLCHNPIPVTEKYCEDCKKKLYVKA